MTNFGHLFESMLDHMQVEFDRCLSTYSTASSCHMVDDERTIVALLFDLQQIFRFDILKSDRLPIFEPILDGTMPNDNVLVHFNAMAYSECNCSSQTDWNFFQPSLRILHLVVCVIVFVLQYCF